MLLSQPPQDLASDLPVGAVPRLPAPRWPGVRRSSRNVPGTEIGHRALLAPRTARHTDEGAELHDSDVPDVRLPPGLERGSRRAGKALVASCVSARVNVTCGKALPSKVRARTRRTFVSTTTSGMLKAKQATAAAV